jgi:purine nucleosidase
MRLIIDTDAGVDDAQALMLALAHPAAQIEAITTVCGNADVDKVIANVFTTLDVMNSGEIPVYRGASEPLVSDWAAEAWHCGVGLGNYQPRPPTQRKIEAEHAALALIRLANANPGELTLVALAPMTNLALAIRLDPTFPSKIKQFIFMGGAHSAIGNTANVTAEWNIFCDPEAAYITLKAFPQAQMISWEATLEHSFTWAQYDELTAISTRAGAFFKATGLRTSSATHRAKDRFLLPDPLAMAVALEPSIVRKSAPHYVTVELGGTHSRGQTILDHRKRLKRSPNVEVVTELDTQAVFEMFQQTFRASPPLP